MTSYAPEPASRPERRRGWAPLGQAPAYAQKRALTFLSFNSFVPASDEELRRQAETFGKQAGADVRVDTIASLQLPAKLAAEAHAQSGHDIVRTSSADPFLYKNLLTDVGDVDKLGKQHGGWYPFAAESCQTGSGWRSVPWHWNSFPANYNMTHFKKAGLDYPRTWAELLKHGKVRQGLLDPQPDQRLRGRAHQQAADRRGDQLPREPGRAGGNALRAVDPQPRHLEVREERRARQGAHRVPLKHLAEHPIWDSNPKFAMLPKEAEYGHARGWPAKPSAASAGPAKDAWIKDAWMKMLGFLDRHLRGAARSPLRPERA